MHLASTLNFPRAVDAVAERIQPQQLVDGGYLNVAGVGNASARGVEVFCPPRANRTYHIDPLTPQPGDSPALATYRQRLDRRGAKRSIKNAPPPRRLETRISRHLKTGRGLERLLVRG